MRSDLPAPDRRAALKERHRRAIIDAAAALMSRESGPDFTVDELADRADVSRRTVFNHFASVDDIVTAVGTEVLSGVMEGFVSRATAAPTASTTPGSIPAMFDEVAHAVRTTDLVTPMAYLTRILGPHDGKTPWRAALMLRSFHEVSDRFSARMVARHPDADPLSIDLLVDSLMSGLMVLYRHWYARTGGADDDRSRQVWADMVDRLVETVRAGYRPSAPAPAPAPAPTD